MSVLIAVGFFLLGVVLAVWATERLLEGLVSLALALRLSAFAVGAVLSGFEAENVAALLAAGAPGTAPVALGTVFGGAIFLVCAALGVGAVLFPLEIRLPRWSWRRNTLCWPTSARRRNVQRSAKEVYWSETLIRLLWKLVYQLHRHFGLRGTTITIVPRRPGIAHQTRFVMFCFP